MGFEERKNELHDRILNTIPGAVFYTDLLGQYLWCNVQFEQIVGLPRSAIINHHALDVFQSEKDPFLDLFDRLPDTGEWLHREADVIWTGQIPRSFICHLTRFWDPMTKESYYLGFLREVTERKKAQLSLLRANQALRTLHEFHRLLFFVDDEELLLQGGVDRIVESGYSLAWIGILEKDQKESVTPVASAGNADDYIHSLDISLQDPIRSRGPTGQALKSMVPAIIRDILTDERFIPWREKAREFGFRSVASLPFMIESDERAVLTVYSNEPSAFHDEEMVLLQRLTEDLGLALRTIRVQTLNRRMEEEKRAMEEQLVRVQKVEVVGTMAGGMAHDFNNLLNVIRGYTQLLLRKKHFQEEDLEDLREIDKTVEEAANLTKQILLLGKSNHEKPSEVDLNERIDNTLNLFSRLVQPGIEIHFEKGNDLPRIHADPVQINQVILNLLINANDAIQPPGSILIRTEQVHFDHAPYSMMDTKAGSYVRVIVEDTGIGMDEETRNRVFDPFFTTKRGGKGTGLGLAVTIAIVNRLHGWINLYSEPGKGSSFKVHFHASTMQDGSDYRPGKTSIPPLDPTGKKILYIDDDMAVQGVTRRMLEELGFTVTAMSDPLEVISTLEHHPGEFDLILSDVVMPGISGIELAKRIRLRWPSQKILLCSGYTGKKEETTRRSMKFPFLQKPYDMSTLEKTIAMTLLGLDQSPDLAGLESGDGE